MNRYLVIAAAALATALPGHLVAQSPAELDDLKAEVDALTAKLAAMEAQEKTPGWVDKFSIKGDMRYRYEYIDRETADETRERHRIRARIGLYTQANDTVDLGFRLATGGGNPRSTNQTIGDAFSTKDIGMDLAYAAWTPMESLTTTFGKMPDTWKRTPIRLFYDSDLTPEGIAATWRGDMFFATAEWFQLDENSADDDPQHLGAQLGANFKLGEMGFTATLGYYDLTDVEGLNPCYQGDCNNNTVDANGNLVFDYNVVELDLVGTMTLGGLPLSVFASWAQNGDAEEDTAYAFGATLGKTSDAGTWDVGIIYQEIEKDALYGQYIDATFANGDTDVSGWMFKAGYGIAKNWAFVFTYYLDELNQSLPTKEDFDMFILDLNWKF